MDWVIEYGSLLSVVALVLNLLVLAFTTLSGKMRNIWKGDILQGDVMFFMVLRPRVTLFIIIPIGIMLTIFPPADTAGTIDHEHLLVLGVYFVYTLIRLAMSLVYYYTK